MKQRLYVIPGYGGQVDKKDKDARKFLNIIPGSFEVVPVKIDWKRGTMTDYVGQFFRQYDFSYTGENYVFGFSLGAYVSLIASPYTRPSLQILSSLSPWFKEDFKRLPLESRKNISVKMTTDLQSYSFNDISKRISLKTRNVLFVGENEGNQAMFRARDAHLKLRSSELHICKGAGHDISHKNYLAALESFLLSL